MNISGEMTSWVILPQPWLWSQEAHTITKAELGLTGVPGANFIIGAHYLSRSSNMFTNKTGCNTYHYPIQQDMGRNRTGEEHPQICLTLNGNIFIYFFFHFSSNIYHHSHIRVSLLMTFDIASHFLFLHDKGLYQNDKHIECYEVPFSQL